jgi:hypothetical protein
MVSGDNTLMMTQVVPQLVDFLQKQGFASANLHQGADLGLGILSSQYWWAVITLVRS